MEMHEVREKRRCLEIKIRDLIKEFNQSTSSSVTSVELVHDRRVGDLRPMLADVKVTVEL